MSSSDRGVPRGDHVPAGEQQDSVQKQDANTRGQGVQARAAEEQEEQRQREAGSTPAPDASKGSDRGGNAGWGGAPSGGSVIDKRGPDAK